MAPKDDAQKDTAAKDAKAQRLAAALRANLARRKAQGRARREGDGAKEAGAPASSNTDPQNDTAEPSLSGDIVPRGKAG